MSDNTFPVTVAVTPSMPTAGSVVSIKVTQNAATTDAQVVAISATSGFFSSIPTQVTVPANSDNVTFSATISSSASGNGTVTATSNAKHASATLTLA